ncbi:nuclear transport factor 2 family protein [Streptomyces sp. LP05-1]|uniref:Nuclear transport factor 2 family protein n=1 Tax=Streptomyces pyxinae TaxID=2970734 RepID=A0ABT2CF91_9ACTN|nr:nuclear transport factor 2 family protein [Streptomyces sp. LP05-1]MCS0636078.1 nuclear transport factor 2 family protein [Streptomyces sp. LP05-1]
MLVTERFRVAARRAVAGADRAVAGELRLLDPAVRRSREAAGWLLHPEFSEVGASGRRWSRAELLDALPGMAGAEAVTGTAAEGAVRVAGMAAVELGPELVHLTYETTGPGGRARRSSLWRRSTPAETAAGAAEWRLYYHQGTPAGDG